MNQNQTSAADPSSTRAAPLLQRISLTGPDDRTNVEDLAALSARFPFVEWALLYTPHNEGAPRNPTRAWREAYFEACASSHTAVHLCGGLAFEQVLGGYPSPEIFKAGRLQLNINARRREFTDAQVFEVFERSLDMGPDIILQYHADSATVIERFLATLCPMDASRVHVLLDASKGTGLAPAEWKRPETLDGVYVGHAGGMGPGNIGGVLPQLELLGRPYWADMESGLRTDNKLDEGKVEAVLLAAQAHMICQA